MFKTLKFSLTSLLTAIALGIAFPCSAQAGQIGLSLLGTYATGSFDQSAAEIPAYDPVTQRLFVTNAQANTIDILDISNPKNPSLFSQIGLTGGGVNSVAVNNGLVAVAEQGTLVTDTGTVSFYDTGGGFLNTVGVGSLPDMVTFTPDGSKVLVANEGEPNEEYTVDPEGSISIIDVSNFTVQTADFTGFNDDINDLISEGVRIFGPGATVAQDLEPEYITATNQTAWISLQENNAFAIVDIANATVQDIVALGFKDHSSSDNTLDASDEDGVNGEGAINLQSYPNLFGMYQPDTIASYTVDGQTYIVTANEGDGRDYDGFSEEERVGDLTLDSTVFLDGSIQDNDQLGRLTVTTTLGDTDNDGEYEQLYAFGARSFSIWDEAGNLVYDSEDDFETILASLLPQFFNSDNDEPTFDTRSDAKGPEPEALTIGIVGERIYAFIGLERIGGIIIYDITDPNNPFFVTYTNNRDFAVNPPNSGTISDPAALDSGPEGLVFINPEDSPTHSPLLVVANEVSGTTSIYSVTQVPEPSSLLGLAIAALVGGVLRKASKSNFSDQ
ncbi:MAG: choice-of-anchor I family protein [Microcystaceae cyanobacterium]